MPRAHSPAQRLHSKLSPSGASRWMACPGSVALTETMADISGAAADEGTCAHKVFELSLTSGNAPHKYVKQTYEGVVVTGEMCEAVEVGTDWVRAKIKELRSKHHAAEGEVMIPILDVPGNPGMGHVDYYIAGAGELWVADYKHGAGIPVEARGNPQLRLYTIGVLDALPPALAATIKKVTTVIIQPRCPHPEGPIRFEELTIPALRSFSGQVAAVVAQIIAGPAPLVAGETQCKWCPAAKKGCAAFAKKALSGASVMFSEFTASPKDKVKCDEPKLMTNEQLGRAMANLDLLRMFISNLEKTVQGLMMTGHKVPFVKLVRGKSNRTWVDKDNVMGALAKLGFEEDEYAPRSLEGIGAIEKLLPKDKRELFMKKHAVKPPGKPTIALESDPREAIMYDPKTMFIDEMNEEPAE